MGQHEDRIEALLWERESQLVIEVQRAFLDVAKGSIDRSIQRANFVIVAAGAIGGSYGGLLGVAFSKGDRSLPPRAITPSIYLGVALFLAAVYSSFLRNKRSVIDPEELIPSNVGPELAETRLRNFIVYATEAVWARAWALRLAVVTLGLGVALLPVGFVHLSKPFTSTWLILATVLFAVLWLAGEGSVAICGWLRARKDADDGGS